MATDTSYWDGMAPRYDLSMRLLGGPIPEATRLVAQAVAGRSEVLEVAAGTGLFTVAMAPVVGHLLATDYSEAMVDALAGRVSELDNVDTRTLDLAQLCEEAAYDAVVAANVLHLLDDPADALMRMVRALKPGGLLVVPTYLHAQSWLSRWMSAVMTVAGFPGQRRYDLDGLVAQVERVGASVIAAERVPGLLPMGVVVARWDFASDVDAG